MSRFSLIPEEFSKIDHAMAQAEAAAEWPALHGDGLPWPFKKLAVRFETPMLERILRRVEKGKRK